jgi:hypothetical protein
MEPANPTAPSTLVLGRAREGGKAAAPPRTLDRLGATASFLCAIHCATLPLVVAILPALGLGFLASHGFERAFVACAAALALGSLAAGFRHHRRWRAFAVLLPGLALMCAGIIADAAAQPVLHAALVVTGGLLVAGAHLANLRLAHAHAHAAVAGCAGRHRA